MHRFSLLSLGLWRIEVCFIFCCRFCSSDIFRACEPPLLWNTLVICHLDRKKSCINMWEQKISSFYLAMTGIVKMLSYLVLYFPWCAEDSSLHNSRVWLAQRGAASAQSSAPAVGHLGLCTSACSEGCSEATGEMSHCLWVMSVGRSQHCHCHHSSPHMPSSTEGQTGFWTSCKKCIHCHECTAVTHGEGGCAEK